MMSRCQTPMHSPSTPPSRSAMPASASICSGRRGLWGRFDAVLRPLGLTNGQFSLLMSLNRSQPPGIGGVSALLAMDRTTLTANLKPLVRRGLVEVVVGDPDKRSRRLNLTSAGRALLIAALPLWQHTHAAIEGHLARSDPEELRRDLRLLALQDGEPDVKWAAQD